MADIPVEKTKGATLHPAQEKPDDRVQVNPGNTSVLTVQLLAAINRNLVELNKKLDVVIEAAKE
jgi:hypothetical protein